MQNDQLARFCAHSSDVSSRAILAGIDRLKSLDSGCCLYRHVEESHGVSQGGR